MKLGEVGNADAAKYGKPLDGVRILAVEQMQALPFATQQLARLGAEVVKVEHPIDGEPGRGSLPAMLDPQGRPVGCTYLRNNLNKRSLGLDLKTARGRDIFLELAPKFDVVAENFKPGAMAKFGLSYGDIAAVHPSVIYASVSGFGNNVESEYRQWPAFAPVAESMSGLYTLPTGPDDPPIVSPAGALGDTGAAVFAVIGILAALRQRDRTGEGQHVDIAMYDCMIAFADMVPNYWSMGLEVTGDTKPPLISQGFRARDGWFIVHVGRMYQFERLASHIGRPEWLEDDRLSSAQGWYDQLEQVIRPGIETWAATLSKKEACHQLAAVGVAAGPVYRAADLAEDQHIADRNMLLELERSDGIDRPILIPGNPVKMGKLTDGPHTRPPWVGEQTEEVLRAELGLGHDDLAVLRSDGVIT
ncbi:MAG: CoA transferase [Deltaproteobacteria bacterium]|nr:CoA transferase [Deltaproteobacteria bacterium]